ncbi:MAG: hypothetical protein AMS26_19355 [Bacteroides sp. SM23_62]|nr:MAG: hypothetical protein AMS26_19355 [Bacteroides sp. SM23_62]
MEGKLEAWKSWNREFTGSKKNEFDEFNQRYGLTRHDVWLVDVPNGAMAVVLHEGPGADSFMQKLGQSDQSFDLWMRQHIEDFHDMRLDQPPPGPPPVKMT